MRARLLRLALPLIVLSGCGMTSSDLTAPPDKGVASPAPDTQRWVVVLDDPRPARRQGWSTGVGYTGSTRYDEDPALQRLAARVPIVRGRMIPTSLAQFRKPLVATRL